MKFVGEHPWLAYAGLVAGSIVVSAVLMAAAGLAANFAAMLCFAMIGGGYVTGVQLVENARHREAADAEARELRRLRETAAELAREQANQTPPDGFEL